IERRSHRGVACPMANRAADNQKRNPVGSDRNGLASVHTRAVVGDDRENGVLIKRFLLGEPDKFSDRKIRVLDRVGTALLIRIFRNAPAWIGVRLVIGNGEKCREEWFVGGV